MRSNLRTIVLMLAIALPGVARASLTAYDFVLTVLGVQESVPCSAPAFPGQNFGCMSLGQSFRGSFSVDSSILAVDGLNQSASIYDFDLPFGALTYSTGANNDALSGFRNGLGFAAAPGFVISGGQVVDFYGGLFGRLDVPFIDMYRVGTDVGPNQFRAQDGHSTVTGSLIISSPAPEPEIYAMLALGFGLVVLRSRRAQRRSALPR